MIKRLFSGMMAVIMVFSLGATAVPAAAIAFDGDSGDRTGEEITAVKVSNITTPVAGANPDFDVTLTGTGMSLDYSEGPDVSWWNFDPLASWEELDESSVFAPGIYELEIYLKADDGYVFTEDTNFYFDAELLPYEYDVHERFESFYWAGGEYADIYIYFIVEPAWTSTVNFDANGGSGTMAPATKVKGVYTLPECGFTSPEGKEFKCWSIDDTEKQAGDVIFVDENTTVTAVWEYANTIKKIYIKGIKQPVAGQLPDLSGITTTTEGITLGTIRWYTENWEVMTGSMRFEAGKKYTLDVRFSVADGYNLAEDLSAYHDLPRGYVKLINTYSNYITIGYTVPEPVVTPITSVKVSDVTTPVLGATPDFDVTLTGTGVSLYEGEVPAVKWWMIDPDSDVWSEGSESVVFGGGLYCVGIAITAQDGYEFTEDTEFYFGEELLPPVGESYRGCYMLSGSKDVLIYYFFEIETVEINNINITGIVAPVAGQSPAVLTISTDTPGITVKNPKWYRGNGTIATSFVAGGTYTLMMEYTVAEGYALQEGATLTYNLAGGFGGKIIISTGYIGIQYTVPEGTTYNASFSANGGTGTMPMISGVSGSYTLPECGFTAPAGKRFKCWKVGRLLQKPAGSTIVVKENTSVVAVWEDIPDSMTVSGTVTSYGSTTDDVTIQLILSGTSEAAYETAVKGNSATYNFPEVAIGTYTMRIIKENHVQREYTVVVDGSVVQDVQIFLKGDTTGDGKVNMKDWSLLYDHISEVSELTDYNYLCADVTGDGKVNMKDWSRLYDHISEVNPLW